MSGKPKKAKMAALIDVCQTKAETQEAIKAYGEVSRELSRIEAELNDAIAQLVDDRKAVIDELKTRADGLLHGIQLWCETHRDEICVKDKKSADLLTGEVAWKINPPSVTVRGEEAVIELLRGKKLYDLIRVKESVNKEAILANQEAVEGIPGIKVITGRETFYVTPFEVEIVQ